MRYDFLHGHKKLIWSGLFALGIFLFGFYILKGDTLREPSPALAQNDSALPTIDVDTDGDGLPDWKERIYGTDIHNKDTDGDGTSDGDEVRLGRNPLVRGPNDKLNELRDPNFATSSSAIDAQKKEFYDAFLKARSAEIKETTFKDLIHKNVDPAKYRPTKELADLNITSDNSDEGVKEYLNSFGVIIKKYSVRAHPTEDEILAEATQTKSEQTLRSLDLPAIDYKNFSKDLLALAVPSGLATHHLLIVNGYEGMSRGLFGMKTMFVDPVNGSAGYEAYMRYRFDVTTGYAGLVSTVGKRNITFEKTEAGYPFYWNTVAKNTGKNNSKNS